MIRNKKFTLREIADFLHAELVGDTGYVVTGIAPLDQAQSEDIAFLEKAYFRKYLATTKAGAVILSPKDRNDYKGNAIVVANPYVSYAFLTGLFQQIPIPNVGVNSRAMLGENCSIHTSARIANCILGNNVSIGANTVIEAGCCIGDNVAIGSDCHIYANVSVYYGVSIGNQVIIHSGAVIGADGFGMANASGTWQKIFQLGSVSIGDNVEIGANTCIDRGALEDTILEDGVKLDNLIQIGHNAKIGAHTVIAGCTAVAGSTIVGKHCMIGGGSILNGHIEIVDNTVVTGSSTVGRSITKPGIYSSGLTVQSHMSWLKSFTHLVQLDKIVERLTKLEKSE